MTKPSNFIKSSDYPTLKNDITKADVTVTVPSSITVAGSGSASYSTDVVMGVQGALSSSRISSSKDSNIWYKAQMVVYTRTGTNDGFTTPYNVVAFVWRVNATTLRCQVFIPNPYSTALICEAGVETISFHVNSFVPPF